MVSISPLVDDRCDYDGGAMQVLKSPNGEEKVMQRIYSVYIDPSKRLVEWDIADTTGRAVMHVGLKLNLHEGKFGGEAKDFVVVAIHPGRDYDVVGYEKAAS
jgi:hypothetical protein